MNDQVLVWLSVALIVILSAALVTRTVLVERAAGTGSESARYYRPLLVRRLDLVLMVGAGVLVAAGILRIVFGTLG